VATRLARSQLCSSDVLLLLRRAAIAALFPYTTLFRSASGSRPCTRTRPLSGVRSPAIISTVVVFPAPFGPRIPKISPRSTVRLRSEEHTSELQSRENLVCRLLLEKRKRE